MTLKLAALSICMLRMIPLSRRHPNWDSLHSTFPIPTYGSRLRKHSSTQHSISGSLFSTSQKKMKWITQWSTQQTGSLRQEPSKDLKVLTLRSYSTTQCAMVALRVTKSLPHHKNTIRPWQLSAFKQVKKLLRPKLRSQLQFKWHKRHHRSKNRPCKIKVTLHPWCNHKKHTLALVWYHRITLLSHSNSNPVPSKRKALRTTTITIKKSCYWCSRQNSVAKPWCKMFTSSSRRRKLIRNRGVWPVPKPWKSGKRRDNSKSRIEARTTKSCRRIKKKNKPITRSPWTRGKECVPMSSSQHLRPLRAVRMCQGWRQPCWPGSKT